MTLNGTCTRTNIMLLITACFCMILRYGVAQEVNSTSSCQDVYIDVVVVGAGMTGIFAAQDLNEISPDLDVVVVEATDRIGGRVKKAFIGTITNNNMTIELGANWLHNAGSPLQLSAICK
jgi:ribulose 1,5-bisphosphate synthetase/thiazole synthase